MNRILGFISIVFFISCNGDDDAFAVERHKFRESIVGVYYMESVESDVAVDLNFDGIKSADILSEIDCFSGYLPEMFKSEFIYKVVGDEYRSISFTIPEHSVILNNIPYDNCFKEVSLHYLYEENEDTKEIVITARDTVREKEYGKLDKIEWADNKAHYWIEKRYYTASGWQNVTIHLVYKKDETQ